MDVSYAEFVISLKMLMMFFDNLPHEIYFGYNFVTIICVLQAMLFCIFAEIVTEKMHRSSRSVLLVNTLHQLQYYLDCLISVNLENCAL